ncbi:MAG: type II toxin-antitoxin system RelE/ParE family toxin [Firmicutes bacterium]|nr:type II toxin-antitoxin system RelE/ParE family toxin [Bacillota bacterium]
MDELLFSPQAERFFKKLKEKPLKEAYKTALLELKKNPYIGRPKRGDLAGIYGFAVTYKGVNYEIAYTIRRVNGKKVVVLLAGTRANFYQQLKRYLELLPK